MGHYSLNRKKTHESRGNLLGCRGSLVVRPLVFQAEDYEFKSGLTSLSYSDFLCKLYFDIYHKVCGKYQIIICAENLHPPAKYFDFELILTLFYLL